ncbi:hypothetical protein [Croceicoccus sp. YJ47]|uniref:hypothetical protein n=1 Tax=Croceicoccus sp. YJ47 TaxID=2798724 RepID=UPI00192282AF|nr:hypothetical protein [Croceicoccus sp. YJ47]QQN74829.1 hypothetical protein JD971_03650 [Croceicoccus sp. YJ47]
MTPLHELIEGLEGEARAAALKVLDMVSRPLTVREIEVLLRHGGVSRARAVKLAGTLKHLNVISIIGDARG